MINDITNVFKVDVENIKEIMVANIIRKLGEVVPISNVLQENVQKQHQNNYSLCNAGYYFNHISYFN